ncbi:MAG: DUF362 domain-containing protein [Chloroflexi bacterium]|nr:DUF362 domain-containing protein [Chloroflexota bacterium]
MKDPKGPQSDKKVDVAIARGGSVGESLTQALDLCGGLTFIHPGDTVLVKPNIGFATPHPSTTNAQLVYEMVLKIWQRDPRRVIVGDRGSYRGATMDFMRKSGIFDAAGEAKAETISFDDGPWVRVRPKEATHWRDGFSVHHIVQEADHIISLPVVKTYKSITFTMSLKNAVGMIRPEDRLTVLHAGGHEEPRFGSLIAEINLAARISLVVMDGTRAMIGGGPETGEVVEPGVIIAGGDLVACDMVGLALLKILGAPEAITARGVAEHSQIQRGIELKLGVAGAEAIALHGHGFAQLDELRGILLGR